VNTILYLDLDGVLADFDERVDLLIKRNRPGDLSDDEFYSTLAKDDHFFYNLKPTPYAFDLYDLATRVCDDVQILTALPSRATFESALLDKKRWVHKHFGKNIKVNFGPYSSDKWKHAKPGDILVDDRPSNIIEWRRAGGIGILHRNFKETEKSLLGLM
jgi:hypothetical protein